jgi:nucleotide-binding universal stress UspA family protein
MPAPPARPRLVVPVDFSDASSQALRYAHHLAVRAGVELHVLHVHRPGTSEEGPAAKERLTAFMGAAEVPLAGAVLAERPGDHPATCIVRYATDVSADLVVMSRIGARGLRRYLLGSQTDEVLRTLPCRLLVLPETLTDTPQVHHLLVPVDMTDITAPLVEQARTFAARYGDAARLTVLHALEPLPHAGGWMSALASRLDDSLGESITEEVRAVTARAGGPDVPTDVRVTEGRAAEAILREAAHHDADLIVMASHGRENAHRLLLGSTTERVVRTSDRPVLVVRMV